tara:strand:+ start:7504 stop:8379 length:876 start_codon:yes stop_codon:yes gene_type:complete
MSKGIAALTPFNPAQITVASGSTFAIESLKAALGRVEQMQSESTAVAAYTTIPCLMDNPFSSCEWDIEVTAGSTFAVGTVTCATAVVGNSVTINGNLYTGVAGVKASNEEFSVDTSDTACATDLADSINNDSRTGTLGDVSATSALGVVTLTQYVIEGTFGNATTLAKVGVPITISGATFGSGANDADYQVIFGSEVIANETPIGRPALASRRVLDISIVITGWNFTVRSALAVLNMVEKFEDAVATTGVATTGDGVYTALPVNGPTPFDAFVWDITKANAVYTLTPTATS